MARLGRLLLKGAGVLLLAFVALSVIATVVGIALSIVATAVAAVVTLALLAVVVLAVVGLASLLRGDDEPTVETAVGSPRTDRFAEAADPEERLRSRYVDGELTEAEFERELDRLLEGEDRSRADGLDDARSRDATTDRSRLHDR